MRTPARGACCCVDHGADAAKLRASLAAMPLFMFGDSEVGGQLSTSGATIGIGLPLKALAQLAVEAIRP